MKTNVVIENRIARHNYFIDETIECGIELKGREVKSIRCGMASIKEAWINIENGQMYVKQMHITPWETSNRFDAETKRDIRLLAHKKEISRAFAKVKQDGYTIIPLKVYFNDKGKCKMIVGICKGKKNYDKRAHEKEVNARREIRKY